MRKIIITIIFTILILYPVQSQDSNYRQAQMLSIKRLDSLSQDIYTALEEYRLIMLGEMHGTNEPVGFLIGLAELFAKNGDSVQIGFEIPENQMQTFLTEHTEESLRNSAFFAENLTDGRASAAWANAIAKLNKNPLITVFFYDVNNSQNFTVDVRDSIMYLNIKEQMEKHPAWRTITLSGNIHNMLVPFKGQKTTASFLINDTTLKMKEKLCSLTHDYVSGTMLNNRGNGLELQHVEKSSFLSGFPDDVFLYLLSSDPKFPYHGIFFTRMVTASELLMSK